MSDSEYNVNKQVRSVLTVSAPPLSNFPVQQTGELTLRTEMKSC